MTDITYRPQRNWGARIHDLTQQGMRLIVLENELLQVGILAGKGADIVEINYKPQDLDLIWLAPGGVKNPLPHTTTAPESVAAYIETYPGGWQELFPNAGLPCTVDGIPLSQHGEVFSLPWEVTILEDTAESCAVRFSIRTRTSPCLIEKTFRIESGKAGFRMEERLVNESPATTSVMWGHHATFGYPYLGPGSTIELPEGISVHALPMEVDRRVGEAGVFPWPISPTTGVDLRELPDQGSIGDMLFLSGFGPDDAWYEVTPADGGPRCRVQWDGDTMPILWYWQEFGHSHAYPWYGRVYTVGLEPNTSISMSGLVGALETETALTLAGNETRTFWLDLTVKP